MSTLYQAPQNLSRTTLSHVRYGAALMKFFGASIPADKRPESWVLGEPDGQRFNVDDNSIDDRLKRIYLVDYSKLLSQSSMAKMHGLPFMLLATRVSIDNEKQWKSIHHEIAMVDWDQVSAAGIGEGTTWKYAVESGESSRYKFEMPIINELMQNETMGTDGRTLGEQAVDNVLDAIADTAVNHLIKRTAITLAARPLYNYIKWARENRGGRISILDVHNRATENWLLAVKNPDLFAMALRKAMTVLYHTLDLIILPEACLWSLSTILAENKEYNTRIHDTNGMVLASEKGFIDLTVMPTSSVMIDGTRIPVLACPEFAMFSDTPEEKRFSPYCRLNKLAQAYVFRTEKSGHNASLDSNYLAVNVLENMPTSAADRLVHLGDAVTESKGSFLFDDPDSPEFGVWGKAYLQNVNRRGGSKLALLYDRIHGSANEPRLVNMDSSTSTMLNDLDNGSKVNKIVGWRDLIPLARLYKNPAGDVSVIQAHQVGMMEEPFYPCSWILADIRALKKGKTHVDYRREFARILNMPYAGVNDMMTIFEDAPAPAAAVGNAAAGVPVTLVPGESIQIDFPGNEFSRALQAAYNLIDTGAVAFDANATTTAARQGNVGLVQAGQGAQAPPPWFRSSRLNDLLANNLPAKAFDAVHAIGQQLDAALADPSSERMANDVLDALADRVVRYREDAGHLEAVILSSLDVLAKQPGVVISAGRPLAAPAAAIEAFRLHSPSAEVIRNASRKVTPASHAAEFGKSTAFSVSLRQHMQGPALGGNISIVGAGTDVATTRPLPIATSRFDPNDIANSPLFKMRADLRGDELYMFLQICRIVLSPANISRLAKYGLPVIGGRLERYDMLFSTFSCQVMRKGDDTVITHISPITEELGAKTQEGRTILTTTQHHGLQFMNGGKYMNELCNVFPHKFLGGMNVRIASDISQHFHTLFFGNATYNRNTHPNLFFWMTPRSETKNEWPQFAMGEVMEPTGFEARAANLFFHLSSAHVLQRELLTDAAGDHVPQILGRITSNLLNGPSHNPLVQIVVHNAYTWGYDMQSKRYSVPLPGTGPLGARELNDPRNCHFVYNGEAASLAPQEASPYALV